MTGKKYQLQTLVEGSESFQEVLIFPHGSGSLVIEAHKNIGGFSVAALKKGRLRVNQLRAAIKAGASLDDLHAAIVVGGPITSEVVACLLLSEIEMIKTLEQRRSAGRKPKPSRRSPLRQAIVEAMRPMRDEGLTLHDALLSLIHSPAGALRVSKKAGGWHFANEDEDWSPELLTLEQLQRLFTAARRKTTS